MISTAVLSPCGTFRSLLERIWGEAKVCVFVMLNPSTADASVDDRTVARCMDFARTWGFGGIRIVNLIAYRSAYPAEMYSWLLQATKADLVDNVNLVLEQVSRPDVGIVVCAWGKVDKPLVRYAAKLHEAILIRRGLTYCIKMNKDGSPGHPLYLRKALHPIPYMLID